MSDLAPGHAASRALERFGIRLTVADFRQIMLDITDAVAGVRFDAVLQRKQPDGMEVWFVTACERRIRVCYAPASAAVVTVLSEHDRLTHKVDKQRIWGRGRRERRVAHE